MNDMDQLRADFRDVWRAERREYSHDEAQKYDAAKDFAGQYVRRHMTDKEAMGEMMTIFRGMADQIRHDQARAERIRSEVRAERREAA